ncbi:hypothetical protein GQ600_7043 [Phytophthora cactorum]|nr:hypothetical protein GQ600_7043 [Phytophthora cactorum]
MEMTIHAGVLDESLYALTKRTQKMRRKRSKMKWRPKRRCGEPCSAQGIDDFDFVVAEQSLDWWYVIDREGCNSALMFSPLSLLLD